MSHGTDYHHLDLHEDHNTDLIKPWIVTHGDDAMCTFRPFVAKVSAALGTSDSSALISIHIFSGCDSTIGNGWHIDNGELNSDMDDFKAKGKTTKQQK